jgi:hypothetical protein
MVTQYVWIGIAVGRVCRWNRDWIRHFSFDTTTDDEPAADVQMMGNPQMMNQWNQQMMNDQTGRQQMMTSMMQNQQFMQDMMNDPEFQSQMLQQMRENHDFLQSMFMQMMDDPEIRGQMIGHMMENQEFMEQFQQNMGNQTSSGGMGMMQ